MKLKQRGGNLLLSVTGKKAIQLQAVRNASLSSQSWSGESYFEDLSVDWARALRGDSLQEGPSKDLGLKCLSDDEEGKRELGRQRPFRRHFQT